MKISYTQLKIFSDRAEAIYLECWEILVYLKYPIKNADNKGIAKQIILFQEKLGKAIFDLQSFNAYIREEKKVLINNKSNLKPETFKNRIRLLSKFKSSIENIISVGKGLGDAYAYFFINLILNYFTTISIINK